MSKRVTLDRVYSNKILNLHMKCNFCGSSNMIRQTVTCKDCGTTAPDSRFQRKGAKKKNATEQ